MTPPKRTSTCRNQATTTLTQGAGKLLADAYHAATALEHGCEWYTFDGDFARFPDLRWRHPLAPLRVEL